MLQQITNEVGEEYIYSEHDGSPDAVQTEFPKIAVLEDYLDRVTAPLVGKVPWLTFGCLGAGIGRRMRSVASRILSRGPRTARASTRRKSARQVDIYSTYSFVLDLTETKV